MRRKSQLTVAPRAFCSDDHYRIQEEIEIGLRCVGAPLRDYSGALAGAVSVAGPTARFTRDKISFFADLVKKTAALISSQLGFGQVDLPDEKEARLGRA